MRKLTVAVMGVAVLAGLAGGCESSKSVMDSASALGSSTPSAKGLMDQYLGKMGDLTSVFKGVTDPASAKAALPKATDLTGSLKSLAGSIDKLPPQEKALIGTEYSGKLASAVKGLDGAIAPLQANPQIAEILKPVFGKIPSLGF